MSLRLLPLRALFALTILYVAAPALAQDEPVRPSVRGLFNLDSLLDSHARFLAKRYNLNDDQAQYTQAYLHQKANEFMGRHKDAFYDLVDQLMEMKRPGSEASPQDLANWGKRAMPLYTEMKKVVIDGNNEWRGILNEEQRKTHDKDVQEMNQSFATFETQLQRMVSAQMTVEELRNGTNGLGLPTPAGAPPKGIPDKNPPGGPVVVSPPTNDSRGGRGATNDGSRGGVVKSGPTITPPAPTGPKTASPTPTSGKAGADFESQWEAYVREFIQKYQLDDAQQQRAQAVLKQCQELGRRVVERRKADFDRLDQKMQNLGGDAKEKLKGLQEIQAERAKLYQPVSDIFEKQLKPRLDRLLTAKQRAAGEQAKTKPAGTTPPPGRPAQPPQPTGQPDGVQPTPPEQMPPEQPPMPPPGPIGG